MPASCSAYLRQGVHFTREGNIESSLTLSTKPMQLLSPALPASLVWSGRSDVSCVSCVWSLAFHVGSATALARVSGILCFDCSRRLVLQLSSQNVRVSRVVCRVSCVCLSCVGFPPLIGSAMGATRQGRTRRSLTCAGPRVGGCLLPEVACFSEKVGAVREYLQGRKKSGR